MTLRRLSTEDGARKILQRLIDTNRATIDQFDNPPPGSINPDGYRNLLRDITVDDYIDF
jgi:hypothetical protein